MSRGLQADPEAFPAQGQVGKVGRALSAWPRHARELGGVSAHVS